MRSAVTGIPIEIVTMHPTIIPATKDRSSASATVFGVSIVELNWW
jgi:hypothetical protein